MSLSAAEEANLCQPTCEAAEARYLIRMEKEFQARRQDEQSQAMREDRDITLAEPVPAPWYSLEELLRPTAPDELFPVFDPPPPPPPAPPPPPPAPPPLQDLSEWRKAWLRDKYPLVGDNFDAEEAVAVDSDYHLGGTSWYNDRSGHLAFSHPPTHPNYAFDPAYVAPLDVASGSPVALAQDEDLDLSMHRNA